MAGSSSSTARLTRRTRIVCISDTHNSTVKLPKGDVLIHAGDLTNQGSYSELSKAVQWLEKADFEAKIVIAGNHDITLDYDFYSKHGSSFHNQNPQDPAKCRSLFTSSHTITYLQNSSATVRLTRPDGPGTEFTVFGSPYSPQYGTWAFMYPRPEQGGGGQAETAEPPGPDDVPATAAAAAATTPPSAADLWAAIPQNTDILVTHTPPYTHCDDSCGCEELRKALARIRPRLHVCGHVHQGRGAERVRWDTDLLLKDEAATEKSVEAWQDPHPDPASAKISLVDLTARGGKRPLDFGDDDDDDSALLPLGAEGGGGGGGASDPPDPAQRVPHGPSPPPGPESRDTVGSGGDPTGRVEDDPDSSTDTGGRAESTGQPATRGRRTGRRETCVVNCAIVATGWPHTGGKRFNKPIVVDLDLPVWR